MRSFLQFLRDERGTTSIEYGVIGTVISISIIVGLTSIGSKMNILFFNKMSNGLN